MQQSVRAVYENGQLRLLEPVQLAEGEQIQVVILSGRDFTRFILRDLIVESKPTEDLEDIDEEALMQEIREAFRGQKPLSESIIEDRLEGY